MRKIVVFFIVFASVLAVVSALFLCIETLGNL